MECAGSFDIGRRHKQSPADQRRYRACRQARSQNTAQAVNDDERAGIGDHSPFETVQPATGMRIGLIALLDQFSCVVIGQQVPLPMSLP